MAEKKTTRAVATKTPQQLQYDNLRSTLQKMQGEIVKALPKHIPMESWMRTVLTLVQKNPGLLECTQPSFLGALLDCAQRGLVVGHEAHIVPFRNRKRNCVEAQVIHDYKGYIKLMINSGVAKSVKADVVRVGDEFDDSGEKIVHNKNIELGEVKKIGNVEYQAPKDLKPIYMVYCEIALNSGGYTHRTLTMDEIERARGASKKPDGVWLEHPIEMMKKTAVRRIAKYIPQSPEVLRAVEMDDLDDSERSQGLASVVDETYIPELEHKDASTIVQLNIEAETENEDAKKKSLTNKILKQFQVLEGIGFKAPEILDLVQLKNLKDLEPFDSVKLEAILDVLLEAESE